MSGLILLAAIVWQMWRLSAVDKLTTWDKLAIAYIAVGLVRLAARVMG